MMASGVRLTGVNPSTARAVRFKLNLSDATSTLGNSHKWALTTPGGLWRTRNRPCFCATKAAKRRGMELGRRPRFGSSATRSCSRARQYFVIGQIWHWGCSGVQRSARIISEALPKFVNLLRAGLREGFDVRQFPHPALPVRQDGFDLRLLEHDFRDPDGIRVARTTPGKVARVFGEPFEQVSH